MVGGSQFVGAGTHCVGAGAGRGRRVCVFTAGYSLVARVCVLWRGGAGGQPWSSRGGPGGQGVSVSVGHLGFSTACSIHRSGGVVR